VLTFSAYAVHAGLQQDRPAAVHQNTLGLSSRHYIVPPVLHPDVASSVAAAVRDTATAAAAATSEPQS